MLSGLKSMRWLVVAVGSLVPTMAWGQTGESKAGGMWPTTRWRQHDVQRPHPEAIEPATQPGQAPKGAIVLFDGTNLDQWKSAQGSKPKWKVEDGCLVTQPGTGEIETRESWGDVQLHIEWQAPNPPHGKGQDRGNSGVFLMKEFEIQVLDSYKADTYADGQAGAIYGQYPPRFNAARPPGEWQTYDVAFRRPRFDDQKRVVEPARITVFHNGVLVQDNEEAFGPTSWLEGDPYRGQVRGPIGLQDHDHPVRYRNIWVLPLKELELPSDSHHERPPVITLAGDVLDRYAGRYGLRETDDAPRATITREGDHLMLSLPFRTRPLPMLPISETEFVLPHTDANFTFLKDAKGQVKAVHMRVGDGERDWKRLAD
jgi:hypothetical protein